MSDRVIASCARHQRHNQGMIPAELCPQAHAERRIHCLRCDRPMATTTHAMRANEVCGSSNNQALPSTSLFILQTILRLSQSLHAEGVFRRSWMCSKQKQKKGSRHLRERTVVLSCRLQGLFVYTEIVHQCSSIRSYQGMDTLSCSFPYSICYEGGGTSRVESTASWQLVSHVGS